MLEQSKYEAMWDKPGYRHRAPGVLSLPKFLVVAKPDIGQTVRDLGCGTGRVGAALAEHGLVVTQYDIAHNCRDPGIDLPFVQHDLCEPIPGTADYAVCTDMLEHVPREDAVKVLWNVCTAARRAFLQIACFDHHVDGYDLHLTVENHDWWKEQIEALRIKVLWSEDQGSHCLFYVTAFASGTDFVEKSDVNTPEDDVKANIRANMAAGYTEMVPHQPQDVEIMVLAGGPSLADFEDEIREKRAAGMYLVTVNGTYNWCLERGITPSIQIVCDAREFNCRFVEPPVERVRYLIASQCHPSIPASLPKEQVVLWHSGDNYGVQDELGLEKNRDWFPVFGGSTVILRAIPLLRMLGFDKMHFYGLDSCLRDKAHHAYAQTENDSSVSVEVTAGGRKFQCHPWMIAQAQDFQGIVRMMGDNVLMAVHGDGLISHILSTAATEN